MAEWLGRALQKLLQRFESAFDLKNPWYPQGFFRFDIWPRFVSPRTSIKILPDSRSGSCLTNQKLKYFPTTLLQHIAIYKLKQPSALVPPKYSRHQKLFTFHHSLFISQIPGTSLIINNCPLFSGHDIPQFLIINYSSLITVHFFRTWHPPIINS